jgi:hypothetical protein
MKLLLKRDTFGEDYTMGKLFIDNEPFCDTLEDKCRDLNNDNDLDDPGETKVYGETCIPGGVYKIIMFFSPHFKRILPRLIAVKGFDGILIHPGNTIKDTLGCILVGRKSGKTVLNSRLTFNSLMDKIQNEKDLTIEITHDI